MSLFRFDNRWARELPGTFVVWPPAKVPAPRLHWLNRALAEELGLDADTLAGDEGAQVFSGNRVPEGAEPLAQAYAGHQFGGFSPQLGDGRALLLGEVIDRHGQRRDIALKGSGRTPFSRGGDGKAALGPMLREVLIGEAMHALGVPTTRALAVTGTGEAVQRDKPLPGAVLTRVAASHLRVGSFQYFAARGDTATLQRLLDHALDRHDPTAAPPDASVAERALALLQGTAQRQARLLAQWMNLGFIHGVMNTDNMTISGETIDYGPCAFMEGFDPAVVFSSIDHQGRYAFGNQPHIARWNLARLAEALLPLMADAEDTPAAERAVASVTEVINAFPTWCDTALREGQRLKLGLQHPLPDHDDAALADAWLALLQRDRSDHTLAWRRLADAAGGDAAPLQALVADAPALQAWLAQWQARCAADDAAAGLPADTAAAARAARLRAANPFVIPRNHRVEEALAAASDDGDLVPFQRLLQALRRPFDEIAATQPFGEPAPAAVTACYRTFCGT
jgi:serine/tyrosine/threonine adenylyltransferase